MPVSRNRKKKNSKQCHCKSKTTNQGILDKLLGVNDCRKCDGIRDEFSFKELPDHEQHHWEKSEIVDQIDYFLYCPNCDEYSAIIEIEEF